MNKKFNSAEFSASEEHFMPFGPTPHQSAYNSPFPSPTPPPPPLGGPNAWDPHHANDLEFASLFEPSTPAPGEPVPPLPNEKNKNKKKELSLPGPGEPVQPLPHEKNRKEKKELSPPDRDGLIKTPEGPHVILSKRFTLLFVLVIIMVGAAIATVIWSSNQSKFGYPPTDFSQASYESTIIGIVSLFLTCFFSIVIIRGKVHNLVLGYTVLFMYPLTFYFALKGASMAYLSIEYDDIVSIENYVFTKNVRAEGELPSFFHRLQIIYKCCGTNTVDKLKDWPERLNSQDVPRSCCKKVTKTCGKKLARTRVYSGKNNEPMRTPSGFFISLTDSEMEKVIETGKPVKILSAGKEHGLEIVLNVLKKFYFKTLAESYPPGTDLGNMKRLPSDIIEPNDVPESGLPTSIGCRSNLSLEHVTTIGWKIQNLLDYETSVIHQNSESVVYEWTAWKIPMCREFFGEPPFHLACNLKREVISPHNDVKQMWYISRGISENYVLKSLLWETRCENEKNLQYLPNIPLVDKILKKHNRTSSTVGRFFISFVNKLMMYCLTISAFTAIFLFVAFLIFWKYYSRMKLEEYANLHYPPEFEVLKVRQSDLYQPHVKAEYDKNKGKELKQKDEKEAEDHDSNKFNFLGPEFSGLPDLPPEQPSPDLAPQQPWSDQHPQQPWSDQPTQQRWSDQPTQQRWSVQSPQQRWSGQPTQKRWSDQPPQQPWSDQPPQQPWSGQPTQQPWSDQPPQQPWSDQPPQQPWSDQPPQQPWSNLPPQRPSSDQPSQQPWSFQTPQQPSPPLPPPKKP